MVRSSGLLNAVEVSIQLGKRWSVEQGAGEQGVALVALGTGPYGRGGGEEGEEGPTLPVLCAEKDDPHHKCPPKHNSQARAHVAYARKYIIPQTFLTRQAHLAFHQHKFIRSRTIFANICETNVWSTTSSGEDFLKESRLLQNKQKRMSGTCNGNLA